MDGYSLSRQWFDFSFENPDKICPEHTAIYFLACEQWNRFGQKEKFGFPSYFAMEVLGIKKHQTYKKYFDDLVEWGFIKLIQESKNQYTSCIIAMTENDKPNNKALDKANIEQQTKQAVGTDTIDKQETKNKETKKQDICESSQKEIKKNSFEESEILFKILKERIDDNPKEIEKELVRFYNHWTAPMKSGTLLWRSEKTFAFRMRLENWLGRCKEKPDTSFIYNKKKGGTGQA